jgi:hypothetical protein
MDPALQAEFSLKAARSKRVPVDEALRALEQLPNKGPALCHA